MKLGRVILVAALGLVLVLALAVGAAFNSRVQTWAARKALAGQPGLALTLGRVAAGLHHVDVENVRFAQSGAVLTLPSAHVELPLVAAAREQVEVRRLVARGWTLDLSRLEQTPAVVPAAPPTASRGFSLVSSAYADTPPAPAAAVAKVPAVFAGIFDYLKLPVDLALDGVDLAGEVILPVVANRPPARAKVTITGGGLGVGKAGKFDYVAVVTSDGADAAVRELTIRGTLGVVMDTPRAISRLVAATAAEAIGPQFPTGVKLALDASAARSSYGESYAVTVSSGAKQLAAVETTYPAGASHLGGNWRLDMRDRDLAPFLFGHALPAFEALGEGSFDTDISFAELHASGRLNTTVNQLEVLDPQLSGLGLVHLTADFDVAQRDAATRVDRLAVTLEGAMPVASVQALQAFEFNLKTGELNVADPAKDLLGVALQGLPLAWVAPLLAEQGYVATGGDVQGEFAASARNGGFAIRARAPLTISNLAVAQADGKRLVAGLDISLTASADYTPQGWQVELAPFLARAKEVTVLSVEGKVGRLAGENQAIKVTGKWSSQLPGLLAQPAAQGLATLTSGDGQGDFAGSLGSKQEVQLRLTLANLSAPGAPSLPSLGADVRLDREADGKIAFSAPLRFERDGRKSDLNLAGTGAIQPAGIVLDARVTSEFLAVEDAQILAAPLAAPPAPAAPAAARPAPAPPAAPFWAGVTGQIALSLKKVVYGTQFQVTDLTGTLRLNAGAMKLVNARAGFDAQSEVKLEASLDFVPATPRPYSLAANFALNNFDTVPAFRAIDPGKLPTVEARINVASQVAATGATLAQLADSARGNFTLTSKGGIFRGFAADLTDRIQKSQSRLTAVASFLGVVADDYVNKAKILGDIAQALAEIPFDQLSVAAVRDGALNLRLTEFSLIAPEVRIGGEGQVRHVEGIPLLARPMELQLNLGARGKLGDLIKRAGLLDARQDNLGYAAFAVPLKIGGTLANPDTNEIRTALLNSALERSGLLDSLLGK